jgi:hypothetical protein
VSLRLAFLGNIAAEIAVGRREFKQGKFLEMTTFFEITPPISNNLFKYNAFQVRMLVYRNFKVAEKVGTPLRVYHFLNTLNTGDRLKPAPT